MELLIEVRNVYGNEMIYPANDAARTFASIAGTKTLKRDTLKKAQSLGFTVRVAPMAAEVLTAAVFA
jgi:hypothetical protein